LVVADNRAYDYRKRQYLDNIPLEQPKKQPEVKPRKKPKTKNHILSIAFIFAVSILIIARYAYIAELGIAHRNLKAGYKEVQKEQTDLNVLIAKTVNLGELEQTAIGKLGMQYPDVLTQVVYVNITEADAKNHDKYANYHDEIEINENKYIAYVKSVMGSLLKLLD
jgi:hypothetical protein